MVELRSTVIICLLLAFTPLGCSEKPPKAGPTKSNYERIVVGMTREQVRKILGKKSHDDNNAIYNGHLVEVWPISESAEEIAIEFTQDSFDQNKYTAASKVIRPKSSSDDD